MMRARWLVPGFVGGMGLLGGALGTWRVVVMPPDCPSTLLRAQVHDILVREFALPEATRYVLVRTLEGGWLSKRFVCNAELADDLPGGGGSGRIVHFVSDLDPVTGSHRLNAGIRPGPR